MHAFDLGGFSCSVVFPAYVLPPGQTIVPGTRPFSSSLLLRQLGLSVHPGMFSSFYEAKCHNSSRHASIQRISLRPTLRLLSRHRSHLSTV